MARHLSTPISRRSLLASGAAGAALSLLPGPALAAASAGSREFSLRPAPATVRLVEEPPLDTAAWTFDGTVPGPEIRVRQGERLKILVENGLAEDTTVHWHGVRTPHAMDGVPDLTQKPIAPGETFLYEFDAFDAGTFWYHPHQRSFEQVGRGLYGALIVEEAEPIRVDRDVTWVLDDWRLTQTGAISDDFGNRHDAAHGGRIGNTVTINGRVPDSFPVRRGERVRLRLINAANARIFGLDFAGHRPQVIALDGQPVTPHEPEGALVVLGPAMRADLVIDMTGTAASRTTVVDRFYQGFDYRLVDLAYAAESLRDAAPDWPIALPANPLAEPEIDAATRHEISFNGGMMGGMVMQQMGAGASDPMASMMDMMHGGGIWFVNGVAAEGHMMEPILTLARGASHVIRMTNVTAWHHPIHLHGHSFRVISRNGVATRHREWQDTVLMAPRESVEIALVADNPGDWMFHCHILEHQAAGMMGIVRVA